MSDEKNSLESLLVEIYRNEKNILAILGSLQDIQQSKNERVLIEWESTNGEKNSFVVPSTAYLMQQIKEVQTTNAQLSGVGLRSARIRMPDGSFRKLITSKVPAEESPITAIPLPVFFNKKENRNQEVLINPLPVIALDLTGQIGSDVKKVKIKTWELNLESAEEQAYFDINIKNISDQHDVIKDKLDTALIQYREYEEVYEIQERRSKNYGLFSIIGIQKKEVTLSNSVKETLTLYTLNTFSYKTTATGADIALKAGDKLVINTSSKDTIYDIIFVDPATKEVGVKKIEGSRTLDIGADVVSIYNDFENQSLVEYPVNLSKNLVVFVKPLSPDLLIETTDWGYGISFSTNDLKDVDNITLEEVSAELLDAYTALRVISEQAQIPTSKLIKQDAPQLLVENFRVEVVNNHKKNVSSTDEIKKKFGEKNKIESSIKKIDDTINELKKEQASSTRDKDRSLIKKEIEDNYVKRKSLVNELNSKIDEINANINQNQTFEPKYQIKGLANYPQPKYADDVKKTGKQDTITMEFQFRYLSPDNTSTEASSFRNISNSLVEQTATFSKWIPVPITTVRQKDFATRTWIEEDLANPEEVNANQLAVTITQGENVEIRARSISEVGYPYSLNYSDWSEPIIVEFPQELINNTETIIETSRNEQVLVKFNQQLAALKLDVHTNDSLELADKFYVHAAENIYTSELTPENKPKSSQAVMTELRNEVNTLKAIIAGEDGQISVSITDEIGKKIQDVTNNSTVKLFAGYYKDSVAAAAIPKGEIVNKLYFVEVGNSSDAPLELLSYVPGNFTEKAPNNSQFLEDGFTPNPYYDNYTGYLTNRDEYGFYRRYYYAPASLRGIVDNDFLKTHHNSNAIPFIAIPTFQSSQFKGQLAYSRQRELTLNKEIYVLEPLAPILAPNPITSNEVYCPDFFSGSGSQTFIWDGSQTLVSPNGGGLENDFCVHVLHPEVQLGSEYMSDFSSYQSTADPIPTLPKYSINNSNPNDIKVFFPIFYHSRFFDLESFQTNGLYQLKYRDWVKIDQTSIPFCTPNNLPRKLGFNENDKYLIGRKTCGSYLFLAPNLPESLWVKNTFYNTGVVVKKSDSNKIRIPVIFQYRMTDFYGAGSSGIGRIGGDPNKKNLSYSKIIGVDLVIKNQNLFSFDMKVEAQYAPTSAATATLVDIQTNFSA